MKRQWNINEIQYGNHDEKHDDNHDEQQDEGQYENE